MIKTTKNVMSAACISLCLSFNVSAIINDDDINNYNLAAQGEKSLVEPTFKRFEQLLVDEGATPLTLVYLGGTQALQGRDAWMPWTAMKQVEKGLANIDKGLALLASKEIPLNQQPTFSGLKESFLTQAVAATTYSQLPDMFNHFERGYELYLILLNEPQFKSQPFAASAWVYRYAIKAALRAEDYEQANKWLSLMLKYDNNNPQTKIAQQLIMENIS